MNTDFQSQGLSFGARYVAERDLGRQSSGEFFVAIDTEAGGRVTIFCPQMSLSEQDEFDTRLQDEVDRCDALRGTAYCTVRDGGIGDDGLPYVVVDRPQGTPLSALLRARTRMTLDRALSVAVQLCDLVRRAHQLGIYRAPLSLESIIGHPQPGGRLRVSLVDLGLTRGLYGPSIDLPPADVLYLSPQAQQGLTPSPQDDVFAITALLHTLAFGVAPARMDTYGPADGGGWPLLPNERQGLDQRLEACLHTVLLKGLAPDPTERFKQMDSLQRALTGLRQLMSISAPAFELLAATRARVGKGDDPLNLVEGNPAYDRAVAARKRIRRVVSGGVNNLLSLELERARLRRESAPPAAQGLDESVG